ncbi:cytochrome c3 family protein [Mucilaginibacter sp.]|uniref:cytochrome c3 family protein n=1 Tax=Mucilaginibacter sp. TaxID=1882438 RepID=UPI003B003591
MRNFSLILKQISKVLVIIVGFAALSNSVYAQDPAKGEALFKSSNCGSCHKIDVRMTGPALGPTITSEPDEAYLIKWIQNNQALIAAKNPKALTIYNEYNQSQMSVFTNLSDQDVKDILGYVKAEWKKVEDAKKAAPAGAAGAAVADSGPSNVMVFGLIGVIVIAFLIILVLNRVIGTLERLLLQKQGILPEDLEEDETSKPKVDRLATVKILAKNKKFVFFVVLCGVIGLGSWTWVTLWNTNVHQGYQPVQPIKYSHQLHAGAMKIDCQYCHSGAYKGKNASIPSLNVCMNCHKVVKTESPEIQKIYNALGYDPQTQKYDSTKAKPIQWVRIHNLPDFAYFNHSQHVKVAGIRCQTCHGQIQEMQEVYQYSPLTMKWCIQCHKRTEVNYKGNAYYDRMTDVHDRIKRGEKVTAASLGGIECGKCHY